jgi:hypothetical protein
MIGYPFMAQAVVPVVRIDGVDPTYACHLAHYINPASLTHRAQCTVPASFWIARRWLTFTSATSPWYVHYPASARLTARVNHLQWNDARLKALNPSLKVRCLYLLACWVSRMLCVASLAAEQADHGSGSLQRRCHSDLDPGESLRLFSHLSAPLLSAVLCSAVPRRCASSVKSGSRPLASATPCSGPSEPAALLAVAVVLTRVCPCCSGPLPTRSCAPPTRAKTRISPRFVPRVASLPRVLITQCRNSCVSF